MAARCTLVGRAARAPGAGSRQISPMLACLRAELRCARLRHRCVPVRHHIYGHGNHHGHGHGHGHPDGEEYEPWRFPQGADPRSFFQPPEPERPDVTLHVSPARLFACMPGSCTGADALQLGISEQGRLPGLRWNHRYAWS